MSSGIKEAMPELQVNYVYMIYVTFSPFLGFPYPTVFQGWQTLVAAIILKLLFSDKITPISWITFVGHLPLFVSFVGSIVAGSKALSILPVPVVIAVSNIIPSTEYFLLSFHNHKTRSFSTGIAYFLCLCSVLGIFYTDPVLFELNSESAWIAVHLFFVGTQLIYNHVTKLVLSPLDKLYYSYVFSLIVLTPSSFYLEEAFEALQFHEKSQWSFSVGCILSSILGISIAILSIRLEDDRTNTFTVSRSLACLLSPFILTCQINLSTWIFIIANVTTVCFIPLLKYSFLGNTETNIVRQSEHV